MAWQTRAMWWLCVGNGFALMLLVAATGMIWSWYFWVSGLFSLLALAVLLIPVGEGEDDDA